MYNWQLKDWKKFSYDQQLIYDYLLEFYEKAGISKGIASALSKEQHTSSLIDALVMEAIKTSEIEGEKLNRPDVLSSIKKNITKSKSSSKVKDLRAEGIASMLTKVNESYNKPLTKETLFSWHKLLFKGNTQINSGAWRTHTEPMQIVSGGIGKEIVHFEAPPSKYVPQEMDYFITWFNNSAPNAPHEIKFAALRSAIAHLYFESIHPFEDGNGRIGRAIAEKALIQSLGYPVLISLSTPIEAKRKSYYASLKSAQRTNDITKWLIYFIDIILQALDNSTKTIEFTIKKAQLFDTFKYELNIRQEKVLNRMLRSPLEEFKGGMTAKKYVAITKTSKATATRDIQKLTELGIFTPSGKGCSTSYQIKTLTPQ